VIELSVALMVVLVLAAIFAVALGRRGLGAGLCLIMAIVLLASWAGGLSVATLAPPVRVAYWICSFLVGVLFGLLMAPMIPSDRRPRTRGEALRQADARQRGARIVDLSLIVLLTGLILVLVAVYMR
jgi:hypothetical protein